MAAAKGMSRQVVFSFVRRQRLKRRYVRGKDFWPRYIAVPMYRNAVVAVSESEMRSRRGSFVFP